MNKSNLIHQYTESAGKILAMYPSFDASRTTSSQAYFSSKEGIDCLSDLQKILVNGLWVLRDKFYDYNKTGTNKKTKKVDLILHNQNGMALDIQVNFREAQNTSELDVFLQKYLIVSSVGLDIQSPFQLPPNFPYISSFSVFSASRLKSMDLLLYNYRESITDIVNPTE